MVFLKEIVYRNATTSFQNLLYICSKEKVAQQIMVLAQCPEEEYKNVLKRYSFLIDELTNDGEYRYAYNGDICFVAVPIECCSEAIKNKSNGDVYVGLYEMSGIADPYNIQKEEMKNNVDYEWSWNTFLDYGVFEKSIEKYGADIIVAGVLYYLTYYDYTENEIGEIRNQFEKEKNPSYQYLSGFYKELANRLPMHNKPSP